MADEAAEGEEKHQHAQEVDQLVDLIRNHLNSAGKELKATIQGIEAAIQASSSAPAGLLTR
jgi:hypothetical protein